MMEEKKAMVVASANGQGSVRYLSMALSGATGVLYLLVGLGVSASGDVQDDRARILLAAAVVFFILAACLPVLNRRYVYALGAAVQVVCIVGYFVIAPSRMPHYEEWGIIIKILQFLLLGSLIYLVVRRARPSGAPAALAGGGSRTPEDRQ
jgi:nicotinamide riboside transporter PnuC